MADVDQLIEELFPDERKRAGAGATTGASKPSVMDDWSDDDIIDGHSPRTQPPPSTTVAASSQSRPHHSFDSSSDDEGEAHCTAVAASLSCPSTATTLGPSINSSTLFPVPFPSLPSGNTAAVSCGNRCFLTNRGLALRDGHPSIASLRQVAQGVSQGSQRTALPSEAEAMKSKGAFYVRHPALGNACAPKPTTLERSGGCPHMQCRRCNYVVVRLQGAAWVDGAGSIDLYLTMRNFYPDWSRLASSYPVGVPKGDATELVLCEDAGAAAYCCQCSWLTVRADHEVIETSIADIASVASSMDGKLFATELPLPPDEKRRPPLWVCKGHPVG